MGMLLVISGSAALIYQTLWVKQLGLVVGVEVYAVTTGISAFFAGLAIGGMYLGKRADTTARPLRFFAYLELAIGLLAVGMTFLLFKAPYWFVLLRQYIGVGAWLLPFLLIGIPAFFMGGTLPAAMRALSPRQQQIGSRTGRYYALNTLGAVFGTLLVPFFLIPRFGILQTGIIAGALNLTVAALAYMKDRSSSPREVSVFPPAGPGNPILHKALIVYAIAGGLALGYEVVWSQAIAPLLSSRVFAFAVMLAVYLTGLFLGSLLFGLRADRLKNPWRTFGLLIMCAGISALLIFYLLGPWIVDWQDAIGKWLYSWSSSNMVANSGRFALTALAMLLVPTLFLGAAFPAAVRILAKESNIGWDVGRVAAFNTFGGILGSLTTGFILIPTLGVVKSMGVLAVSAALLGGYALLQQPGRTRALAGALLLSILVTGFIAWQLPPEKISDFLIEKRGGQMVHYQEGAGGSVAVVEQDAPTSKIRRLYIHGVSNSGDAMPSLRYMRLQGLLPLLIHNGDPRSALVIGFGTGITYGSLFAYPGLEHRVCAELLKPVVEAAPYFKGNLAAGSRPSADIRINDGRHELLEENQTYDMITLEPPPPTAAGVVNLYSKEFYKLAKKNLNPKGIVAQWWPLAAQNEEDSKAIVSAFVHSFPYVGLWSTELHEMLLVGSMEPMHLDFERIDARFRQPEVTRILGEVEVRGQPHTIAHGNHDAPLHMKFILWGR